MTLNMVLIYLLEMTVSAQGTEYEKYKCEIRFLSDGIRTMGIDRSSMPPVFGKGFSFMFLHDG